MKIEISADELLELTGTREQLRQLHARLDQINSVMAEISPRLDHHDALLDIHEMRTGGQAIFYRDKPVQS